MIWLLALFLFGLSWVAAGIYAERSRWVWRALALAIFIRPVLFGFFPMPAGFCVFGYGVDYFVDHQRDMFPDFMRSLKAIATAVPIVWVILEGFARARKYAHDHEHLNPLHKKRGV